MDGAIGKVNSRPEIEKSNYVRENEQAKATLTNGTTISLFFFLRLLLQILDSPDLFHNDAQSKISYPHA